MPDEKEPQETIDSDFSHASEYADLDAPMGAVGQIDTALEASRESFEHLLDQIAPSLEQGKYDSLLGDDVSGRIPALVLNEFSKRIVQDRGIQKPSLRFFVGGLKTRPISSLLNPGSVPTQEDLLNGHLDAIEGSLGQRTLIVTDYISHRAISLAPVMKALTERGIAFDIAALATYYSAEEVEHKLFKTQPRGDTNIFIGSDQTGTEPPLYSKEASYRQAIGVEKQGQEAATVKTIAADQQEINEVRHLIANYGSRLYEAHYHH